MIVHKGNQTRHRHPFLFSHILHHRPKGLFQADGSRMAMNTNRPANRRVKDLRLLRTAGGEQLWQSRFRTGARASRFITIPWWAIACDSRQYLPPPFFGDRVAGSSTPWL